MTTTFVLMAGLPGTGKSTLATALAEAVNGDVLNKDTVRAALFPGRLTDYTESQDDLCFLALLEAAAYLAKQERTPASGSRYIFLDGRTFRKHSQIAIAINAAREADCSWRILYLTCPDEVAVTRIARDRRSIAHVARNRDEQLYFESKLRFELIVYPCLQVDTSAPLQECMQLCLTYLTDDSEIDQSDSWKRISVV